MEVRGSGGFPQSPHLTRDANYFGDLEISWDLKQREGEFSNLLRYLMFASIRVALRRLKANTLSAHWSTLIK